MTGIHLRKREEIEIVALPGDDAESLEERAARKVEVLREALLALQPRKQRTLHRGQILQIIERVLHGADSIPNPREDELQRRIASMKKELGTAALCDVRLVNREEALNDTVASVEKAVRSD